MASVFTPSLGTVQECNTSAAVTIIRIGEFNGSAIRLSVSSRRNISICWSCIMYKSNCSFVKSEYPYLQYHWWPTALNIKTGLCMSSINLLKPTGYVMHQQFNPLNTKRRLFYLKNEFVPRSKHFSTRL